MKWHEVSISTDKANEDQLSFFLGEIAGGVSVEHSLALLKADIKDFDDKYRLDASSLPASGIRLLAYFDESGNIEERMAQITAFIDSSSLKNKDDIKISRQIIDETDWENEWKKYFHSFRVSDKFVIVPSWEMDDYEFSPGDSLIKLDPGMAFGTGDHPTTAMCLKFIEQVVKPEDKIIDVGTGSGILSIGAHLMGAQQLKATDIDELSIRVAMENFVLNHCADDILLETGDLLKSEGDQHDIIIANILAHIIEDMAADAFSHLNPGGSFIASGIIVKKKDAVIRRMENAGFTIIEVMEDSGWISILAQKA